MKGIGCHLRGNANRLPPRLSLSSEQMIIYQVGVVPSQFYEALSDKDYGAFKNLAGLAFLLILLNSTVSSSLIKSNH